MSKGLGGNAKVNSSLSIKGQLSTDGTIKIFFEAGASLEVGIKKAASATVADASLSSGVEYDMANNSVELFSSQSFYFFGWNFENTDKLNGGNEKELNIAVKVSAGLVEVEVLMAIPEPLVEMKRASGNHGFGTAYQQRRSQLLRQLDAQGKDAVRRWTNKSK